MYLYLEKSGEPGPVTRKAGTRHFILTTLMIPDRDEVTKAIQELRKEPRFFKEFVCNIPVDYQIALLRLARSLGFSPAVMAVNKRALS